MVAIAIRPRSRQRWRAFNGADIRAEPRGNAGAEKNQSL